MEAGFLRPVFRRIFAPPGPVALLDAKRAERPAADRPAAISLSRIQKRGVERNLVIDRAVELPPQVAGKANPYGKAVDAADRDASRTHEGPTFIRQVCIGQGCQQVA